MQSMNTRPLTIGSLAFALALSCASCSKEPTKPDGPPPIAVRTALAESKPLRRTKTYPGITASVRSVELTARVQGFLAKQHVADGARVEEGTLVYEIDARPFEVALASARADLDRAKAQVSSARAKVAAAEAQVAQAKAQIPGLVAARDLAARDVERNRPLVETGAVSKQAFDQFESKLVNATSQLETAEAAVRTAEAQRASAQSEVAVAEAQAGAATAQVEGAELNLSYCAVKAPMAGLLGKSSVSEGQMVGPSYAVTLNTLVETDPMWVQFSPSATEWPLLDGLMRKGEVAATVAYGGDASITAKGRVVFASNAVDVSTSTIMLRAEFPNASGAFRPGTYANVTLDLGEIPNVVMIPATALVPRETEFRVWRVKADSTVEEVRVRVSAREDEFVGVTEGLAAGDRVVTAGTLKLTGGAKTVEAPPEPGGSPASVTK
jgi:RND family efflux transporter MFP subunit